jgi:hypothetical protein
MVTAILLLVVLELPLLATSFRNTKLLPALLEYATKPARNATRQPIGA